MDSFKSILCQLPVEIQLEIVLESLKMTDLRSQMDFLESLNIRDTFEMKFIIEILKNLEISYNSMNRMTVRHGNSVLVVHRYSNAFYLIDYVLSSGLMNKTIFYTLYEVFCPSGYMDFDFDRVYLGYLTSMACANLGKWSHSIKVRLVNQFDGLNDGDFIRHFERDPFVDKILEEVEINEVNVDTFVDKYNQGLFPNLKKVTYFYATAGPNIESKLKSEKLKLVYNKV